MSKTTGHTIGDTFAYVGAVTYTDENGDAIDLSAWTHTADISFPDSRQTFEITTSWEDAANGVLAMTADTSEWPEETGFVGIRFNVPNGDTVSLERERVTMVKDSPYA